MSTSIPKDWEGKHFWRWYGESISGTERELKRLGIATDATYPRERKGILRCTDPRGLPCEIFAPFDESDEHLVRINYPGRVGSAERRQFDYAEGVVLEERPYGDHYVGTGDALKRAGLVRADQLPGPNAVRKHSIDISPDGHPWDGTRYAKSPDLFQKPGAKSIRRKGKTRFEVLVYVSSEERERRLSSERQKERKYDLDRPYPSIFEIAEHRPRLAVVKSVQSLGNTPTPEHHQRARHHLTLVHSVSRSPS